MISTQKVLEAILKSTGIAIVIFWTLLISMEGWEHEFQIFILLSAIPIFIVSALAYSITILPLILIENKNTTKLKMFRKYFPYYSILAFGICTFFIIDSNFGNIEVCFFTTAFFTSISTWIWLFKPQKI